MRKFVGVDRNLQISHSFAMSQSQGLAFPDQKKGGGCWEGKKSTCLPHVANRVFRAAGGTEGR